MPYCFFIEMNCNAPCELATKKILYFELLKKAVSDTDSRQCMLHDCLTCTGRDVMKKFVEQQTFEMAIKDSDDVISYQQ